MVADRVVAETLPDRRLGVIAYGLPATVAVAAAPALVSVTLVTVSPLTSSPAPVVNSVPANVTVSPYVLVRSLAVMVSAFG